MQSWLYLYTTACIGGDQKTSFGRWFTLFICRSKVIRLGAFTHQATCPVATVFIIIILKIISSIKTYISPCTVLGCCHYHPRLELFLRWGLRGVSVSVCDPGWPGTWFVNQISLWVLELKAFTTTLAQDQSSCETGTRPSMVTSLLLLFPGSPHFLYHGIIIKVYLIVYTMMLFLLNTK